MNARTHLYNLALFSRLALVAGLLPLLISCGAIKNSLKPWVCDCEPEKLACADGSTPSAIAATVPEEDIEGEESEPIESDDGPDDEEKRKRALLETTGFVAVEARRPLNEDTIDELEAEFGLKSELSDQYEAFVGPMTRGSQKALAVLKPGDEIQVFAEGGNDAEREWKASVATKSWIPGVEKPAEAAKMVDDGRLELLVQEVQEKEDGTATIELAVYKVIGIAVARVFVHPIADRAEDGSWSQTHEFRILNGERGRWIEVSPVGEGEPAIYRWNHWEGMFRVPRPVPTAPQKNDSRTNSADPVSNQRVTSPEVRNRKG